MRKEVVQKTPREKASPQEAQQSQLQPRRRQVISRSKHTSAKSTVTRETNAMTPFHRLTTRIASALSRQSTFDAVISAADEQSPLAAPFASRGTATPRPICGSQNLPDGLGTAPECRVDRTSGGPGTPPARRRSLFRTSPHAHPISNSSAVAVSVHSPRPGATLAPSAPSDARTQGGRNSSQLQ